jgi:hypothetical protein
MRGGWDGRRRRLFGFRGRRKGNFVFALLVSKTAKVDFVVVHYTLVEWDDSILEGFLEEEPDSSAILKETVSSSAVRMIVDHDHCDQIQDGAILPWYRIHIDVLVDDPPLVPNSYWCVGGLLRSWRDKSWRLYRGTFKCGWRRRRFTP